MDTTSTEEWKEDFDWLKVRHYVKDTFKKNKLPDLNAVLMMIGINELGVIRTKWTKEEKQDLMHIAVCKLLSFDGHYGFKGLDADGWPHYEWTMEILRLNYMTKLLIIETTSLNSPRMDFMMVFCSTE